MARIKLFVGGIHGTGKGSFCKKLIETYFCEYVSASSLLNWNKKSKLVQDINQNQKLLAKLLTQKTSGDCSYIIDGHFALWDETNSSKVVPFETFSSLGLNGIILITCSTDIIRERLIKRDGISYDIDQIQNLQDSEIKQAKFIAQKLNIPLFVFDATHTLNYDVIFTKINKIMIKYTRENIHSPMLKTVIIRLDFSGATGIGSFVDKIKQSKTIKSKFDSFNEIIQRQVNVDLIPKDMEDERLAASKKEDNIIYRFWKWIPDSSEAILEINNSSMILYVDCETKTYRGSKEYSQLIIELMEALNNYDQYISFKRLGVRKIDIQKIDDNKQIEDYFNEKFIVKNSWEQIPKKDISVLTEYLKIEDVLFNVIQRIDYIKEPQTGEKRIRLIFDVDSYIYTDVLKDKNKKQIESYLNIKMQDKMFDLFANIASEKYLEYCKQKKEYNK